jgi:hypothetical protein
MRAIRIGEVALFLVAFAVSAFGQTLKQVSPRPNAESGSQPRLPPPVSPAIRGNKTQ